MFHTVAGDILLTKADAVAHGIAPNDDFKTGLALSLREKWPSMVKDFRHWCRTGRPKPGEAWVWGGVGADGRTVRIVNLLTQDPAPSQGGHGGRAHLEHVNHALHALHKIVVSEGIGSLALPRLATGVGGLDWTEVEPVVRHTLGDLPIPIYLYATFHKGVAAPEPR